MLAHLYFSQATFSRFYLRGILLALLIQTEHRHDLLPLCRETIESYSPTSVDSQQMTDSNSRGRTQLRDWKQNKWREREHVCHAAAVKLNGPNCIHIE
jgi:hypothetical protein